MQNADSTQNTRDGMPNGTKEFGESETNATLSSFFSFAFSNIAFVCSHFCCYGLYVMLNNGLVVVQMGNLHILCVGHNGWHWHTRVCIMDDQPKMMFSLDFVFV